MKIRLDQLLIDNDLVASLEAALSTILAGEVLVNEQIIDKPGTLVSLDSTVRLKEKCSFVSRGGLKLAKAIDAFSLNIHGKTCIDVGASTGGFTDCLLQHGAAQVFAVDVGYGQFAWKLRQDPRVVLIERFNARNIDRATVQHTAIHLGVIDASFISLTKLIPPLLPLFTQSAAIVALIKPQFELPRELVSGGVVRDSKMHQAAIDLVLDHAQSLGLHLGGVTESPILGPKGNSEFLIYLYL